MALRSSDPVIYNSSTKATVMALEGSSGICNAVIMTKPRAPFLRRWMEHYAGFRDSNWSGLSVIKPFKMWKAGDPDITVLDDHAWFYPVWDNYNYGLMTLWLGKSWWDIERNYGVHFWPWQRDPGPPYLRLNPSDTRLIDTPLFCKIRHLFDDLDGDGYQSLAPEKNANCSLTWMNSTAPHANGLLSDYRIGSDDDNRKWVDSSGNNFHGWAPNGTVLIHSDTGDSPPRITRNFTTGSYAVLPVPADWDVRTGAISMSFSFDNASWVSRDPKKWQQVAVDWWRNRGKEWLLWKIRFAQAGAMDLSLERSRGNSTEPMLRLRWIPETMFRNHLTDSESLDWQVSDPRCLSNDPLSITDSKRIS